MNSIMVQREFETGRKMSKFQSCSCCPYGYHIDLDFVRFCEALSMNSGNRVYKDGDTASKQRRKERRERREKRLQRQSMEVLLGLAPTQPVTETKDGYKCDTGASVQVQNDLQKAVLDFEETLERSSRPSLHGTHIYSSTIDDGVQKSTDFTLSELDELVGIHDEDDHLLEGYDSEMVHNPPLLDDVASVTSNASSTGRLQNIREQMAVSLERMRDLEEQVKLIPVLQVQLSVLKEEKRQLLVQLKSSVDYSVATQKTKIYQPDRDVIAFRDVGVMCSVVTRDVGVTYSWPKSLSVSTQANGFILTNTNLPLDKVEMKNKSSGTDLLMPYVYSETELDQHVAKAIKMYEHTFRHLLHPKKVEKPLTSMKGIQTDLVESALLKIVENHDFNVQVAPVVCEIGVIAKPHVTESSVNATVQKRDFGSFTDKIYQERCKKCAVERCSVRVGTDNNDDRIPLSLNSLNMTRSKSFDYTDRKFGFMRDKKKFSSIGYRSVGCGTQLRFSSTKSTSTSDLKPFNSKDIGVNTMKRKLVSTGVSVMPSDEFQNALVCEKAADNLIKSQSVQKNERHSTVINSRIPRPTTSPAVTSYGKKMHTDNFDYVSLKETDVISGSNVIESPQSRVKTEHSKNSDNKPFDVGLNDSSHERHREEFSHSAYSDVTLFQPIKNEPRNKAEPSKEMRAALKVLNDSLRKSSGGNIPHHMKNANNIVQQEWFKISSTANANPLDVEDYLDCFEEISSHLLEYVVNMTDVSGNTAMHYALSHGNFDVVSILLDSKVCNINQANAAGYTPVMLVSLAHVTCETHRQVVRRLFQLADVNIRAKQHGQTALMLAVSHGRLETVQLLLESGADVNIQDDDGSTALMCAAEHGHINIVKLLFSQPDCDLTITDNDGSTALNIAMEAGNRDIGLLLYAQEHFPQGSSPYPTTRQRRAKSVTPTPSSHSHHPLKGVSKYQDNSF